MYISEREQRIVHQQMLQEIIGREQVQTEHYLKRGKRRVVYILGISLVKLGKSLERFGQAYIEDGQPGV